MRYGSFRMTKCAEVQALHLVCGWPALISQSRERYTRDVITSFPPSTSCEPLSALLLDRR